MLLAETPLFYLKVEKHLTMKWSKLDGGTS